MAPIKVGIIGYGFSTKCFHLPFILPNPDLYVYAFLQRRPPPKTAEERKALKWGHCTIDFPAAKHYTNPHEFFLDQDIELVVVLTGDGTHGEFVEAALNAGKHGEHGLDVFIFEKCLGGAANRVKLGSRCGKAVCQQQCRS